jgi:CRP-like cAMP-binding protein
MMKYSQIYEFAKTKSPIKEEQWLEFESGLSPASWKKSSLLKRPGEKADLVYIILKGILRNYYISSSGREMTKIIRGPGDVLAPYQEILAKTDIKYFIQAITDVEVLEFSYQNFQSMMDRYHEWERLGRILAEENFLEKEKREFMLMHMSAEERYQEFLKDFSHFKDEIPQYQIANYLGISPEALNRQIKKKS